MASQVESIKWVPGTRLMVDGFGFVNPKCQHYFLTHMHSDHTTGLTKSFNAGTIYASQISACLLEHEWGLKAPTVQVLQLGQAKVVEGVAVTAIDANHCPGAVMLLFEVPKAAGGVTRILHTGDCRWQDKLKVHSCLSSKVVDILMLDTTYAVPRYTFPPQQEAIDMMVKVMQRTLDEEPASLFVVGSYHIGKERAYLGAAQAMGLKVYASAAKRRLLQLLDLPQQQLQLLTDDPESAPIHVGQLGVTPEKLRHHLDKPGSPWKRVVGFRPTGWSYKRSGGLQVWREGAVEVVGIPYSEHSSWNDLRACVAALRPKKIIPTVNAADSANAARIIERFADLMDHSTNRGRLDAYFLRKPTVMNAALAAPQAGKHTNTLLQQSSSSCSELDAANSIDITPVSAPEHPHTCHEGSQLIDQVVHIPQNTGDQQSAPWSSKKEGFQLADAAVPDRTAPVLQRLAEQPDAAVASGTLDCSSSQLEPDQQGQVVSLSDVDIKEQERLLAQIEQLQRMKRARELLATAKITKRKRTAALRKGSIG